MGRAEELLGVRLGGRDYRSIYQLAGRITYSWTLSFLRRSKIGSVAEGQSGRLADTNGHIGAAREACFREAVSWKLRTEYVSPICWTRVTQACRRK